jgi:hypothetical protein
MEAQPKDVLEPVTLQRAYREPRAFPLPKEEATAHEIFLEKLKNPLWRRVS